SARRMPTPVIRAHRRRSHPPARNRNAGAVPITHLALFGSAPHVDELVHRNPHVPARNMRDVRLGDVHTSQADTHHRHSPAVAYAGAGAAGYRVALRAARAVNTDGAACGGAVVLAPELGTAYLTVKGTGRNFRVALRAAALDPKLSALKPLDGEPLT